MVGSLQDVSVQAEYYNLVCVSCRKGRRALAPAFEIIAEPLQ